METPLMSTETEAVTANRVSPRELRRLSPAARDAILLSAAKDAETEYLANGELTSFEAFGKEDLHVESANTQAR
jgi:hypothetical protein